jgi:hypothetical protein
MYNIAIIGIGELGSRHLQGAKRAKVAMNLYAVDPNEASLALGKKRYNEIEENEYEKKIVYLNSITELPQILDVVIVATNSAVRCAIALELIKTKTIQNFLLEKFLFQSEHEYEIINTALKNNNINCLVNCCRRAFFGYQSIKEELAHGENLNFHASGSNWGIGCNAIHYIDLFAYLTNDMDIEYNTSALYPEIYLSKRNGYIEFAGIITGKTKLNNLITLSSSLSQLIPTTILLQNSHTTVLVCENNNSYVTINNQLHTLEEKPLGILYQSQLTGIIIEQILSGTCQLTGFDESSKLHTQLLKPLLSFYNSISNLNTEKCPIT